MKLWQKILSVVMIVAGVFLVGGEAWAEKKILEAFTYEKNGNLFVGNDKATKEEIEKINNFLSNEDRRNKLKEMREKVQDEIKSGTSDAISNSIREKVDDEIKKYDTSPEYKTAFGNKMSEKGNAVTEDDKITIKADLIKKERSRLEKKFSNDKALKEKAVLSYIAKVKEDDDNDQKKRIFYYYTAQSLYPDLDLSNKPESSAGLNMGSLKNDMSSPEKMVNYDVIAFLYTMKLAKVKYKNINDDSKVDEGKLNSYQDTKVLTPNEFEQNAILCVKHNDDKCKKGKVSYKNKPGIAPAVPSANPSNGSSNPGGSAEQTEAEKQQEQCRKNAGFLGFLICPFILQTSNNVMEWAYRTIYEDLSRIETSVLEMKDSNPVFTAWAKIRDLANIVFIIVFLIVVLSQITGIGIDNYGIKKILPKLIASAILINLSFIISQLFVDTSNLLGVSLSKIFSITEKFSSGSQTYSPDMKISGWANALSIGAIVAGIFALLLNPGIIISLALLLIPMIGALLLAVALLMVRQAVAIMLVVTSPIAIALMLLPNTKSFVDRYKKLASAMWLFYPICAIVVGGSNFAARVFLQMVQSGKTEHDFLYSIMAIAVMTLPFFATPGILRKTMDGVGGIGSKLTNFRNRSVGKIGEKAKNSDAARRARNWMNTHNVADAVARKTGNAKVMGVVGRLTRKSRAAALQDRAKLNQEKRELEMASDIGYMNEREELAKMEHAEKMDPGVRSEKIQAAHIRHAETMDATMREDRMRTAEMNHQVSMADAGSRVGMAGYYNTMTDAKINSAQSRTEKQMRDATMDAIGAGNLEISGGSWMDGSIKHTAPTRITNPNDASQMRQALEAAISSGNHITAGALTEYMGNHGMLNSLYEAYDNASAGGGLGIDIQDASNERIRTAMANATLSSNLKTDALDWAKWAKNVNAGNSVTLNDSMMQAIADAPVDSMMQSDDAFLERSVNKLGAIVTAAGGRAGVTNPRQKAAINGMDKTLNAITAGDDTAKRLLNRSKDKVVSQVERWKPYV